MDTLPRTSGIYKWTCVPTKKIYIGSAADIRKRHVQHIGTLRTGKHVNCYLQNAWNKYGEAAFTFEVIELVLETFRLEREQYWLDKTRCYDRRRGFNTSPTAGTNLGSKYPEGRGRKWTPEQREALRQQKIGRPLSTTHRQNMIAALKGKKPNQANKDARFKKNAKYWIVTDPNGVEYQVFGLSPFCRAHGLDDSTMRNVADGKFRQHRGWTCRQGEPPSG